MAHHDERFPKRIWDSSRRMKLKTNRTYSAVGYFRFDGAETRVVNNTSFLLNIEVLGSDLVSEFGGGVYFIKVGEKPQITQVIGDSTLKKFIKHIFIIKSGDDYILKLRVGEGAHCVISVANFDNDYLVGIGGSDEESPDGGDIQAIIHPELTDGLHSTGEVLENGERVFSEHHLPPIADEAQIRKRESKRTFITPFGLGPVMDEVDTLLAALSKKIDNVKAALNTHKESGDHDYRYYKKGEINQKVDTINSRINSVKSTLEKTISDLDSKLTKSISDLDTKLTNRINTVKASLESALQSLDEALNDKIDNTKQSLQNAINGVSNALGAHKSSSDHDERYYTKTQVNSRDNQIRNSTIEELNSVRSAIEEQMNVFMNDANAQLAKLSNNGFSSGDIKIHNGSLDDIPDGWVLCDGNNGTPPMVNRAVVGAGDKYGKNQTFGSDSRNTANHTLSTSQSPSHNHKFYGPYSTHGDGWGNGSSDRGGYANLWPNKNATTTSSGGSNAHSHGIDTRQASIAVIWIMKL